MLIKATRLHPGVPLQVTVASDIPVGVMSEVDGVVAVVGIVVLLLSIDWLTLEMIDLMFCLSSCNTLSLFPGERHWSSTSLFKTLVRIFRGVSALCWWPCAQAGGVKLMIEIKAIIICSIILTTMSTKLTMVDLGAKLQ